MRASLAASIVTAAVASSVGEAPVPAEKGFMEMLGFGSEPLDPVTEGLFVAARDLDPHEMCQETKESGRRYYEIMFSNEGQCTAMSTWAHTAEKEQVGSEASIAPTCELSHQEQTGKTGFLTYSCCRTCTVSTPLTLAFISIA